MLIEFKVSNFRSIKETAMLSMIASSDDSSQENIDRPDILKGDAIIKSAAIFGANASGKTNIIFGLNVLRNLVLVSHLHQKGQRLRAQPFKLDPNSLKKPVSFEVTFISNGEKFIYGLSYTNEEIIEEHLYHFPRGWKARIFTRQRGVFKFSKDIGTQNAIAKNTLSNMLYLSSSTKSGYQGTSKVFDWFKDTLTTIGPAEGPMFESNTIELLNKSEKHRNLIMKVLSKADLGIDQMTCTVKEISSEELPSVIRRAVEDAFSADTLREAFSTGDKWKSNEVVSYHKARDDLGKETSVPFIFHMEESEGTIRLFSLIGAWIEALEAGKVLVVDELDTKLHHVLQVMLIELFHSNDENKNAAQLIFTTHNVCLLDVDGLLRRDQVWFTEKDFKTGNTQLYSLLEFKPRKDKNMLKGYLMGRYGGLPFIRGGSLF